MKQCGEIISDNSVEDAVSERVCGTTLDLKQVQSVTGDPSWFLQSNRYGAPFPYKNCTCSHVCVCSLVSGIS